MERCEICGTPLFNKEWIKAGIRKVCMPQGQGCHALWQRSQKWNLTEAQAKELLNE
jgi:hypothetical protein